MRTAADPLAVDNFALWDTFTRYPQDKRLLPHRRLLTERTDHALMSFYDAPR